MTSLRRVTSVVFSVFSMVWAAGCGETGASDESAVTLPSGTIASAAFEGAASSGFSTVYPAGSTNNPNDFPITVLTLVFASKPRGIDYCSTYITRRKDETVVIAQVAAQGEDLAPGTFALVPSGQKVVPGGLTTTSAHLDDTCRGEGDPNAEDATKGTLTIESISPTAVRGAVDLEFPSGALKGAFVTNLCAKTATELANTSSTCMD